jgi:hypothetical protein
MACAADSSATLELIGAAVSREELNALYVKNGTLLILTGGTKKVAHKVSQTGGSKAPFRVHFAACPGTKPVADTIINIEDLAGTMNANGRLAGAEHLLFGYKGGAFRGANGMHLHVVDVVGAAGREGSISKVSVVTWATGETRPDLSTATTMEIEDFLRDFHGEPLSKPVAESIGGGEMPPLARVLQTESDVAVKPIKRKRSARNEPPPAPTTNKSTKQGRAEADLLSLVPRCGTVSRIETARVIFEEDKVRKLADVEPLPDDSVMAGREFRFEARANEGLGRLLDIIGRAIVPSRPPRDMRALQRTAEAIYSAVGAVVRSSSSSSGGGSRGRQSAKRAEPADSSSEDEVTSAGKTGRAQSAMEVRTAVPPDVAGRLYEHKAALKQQWADAGGDPAAMMASVNDAGLRKDLQRAMMSDGSVYAPGETHSRRRHLIPTVHRMREAMIADVVKSVRACAGSDRSGQTHVSAAQATPLAEGALAGELDWPKFSAASQTMRMRTAKAVGTVGELAQTCEMMEAAWSASIHLLFGVVNDSGLRDLSQQLGSLADRQSASLGVDQRSAYVQKLTLWVARVAEHYTEAAGSFRSRGGDAPTVAGSMSALDTMLSRIDAAAETASEMANTWFANPQAEVVAEESPSEDSESSDAGADSESSDTGEDSESSTAGVDSESSDGGEDSDSPMSGDASEAANAWPGEPLGAEAWPRSRSLFKVTFSAYCSWYCMAKCTDGAACSLMHEVPEGFDEFCEQAADL